MFATPLRLIPLDRVIKWIEKKRINPKKVITIKRMYDERLAPKATNFGIKLIRGKVTANQIVLFFRTLKF